MDTHNLKIIPTFGFLIGGILDESLVLLCGPFFVTLSVRILTCLDDMGRLVPVVRNMDTTLEPFVVWYRFDIS